MKCWRFPHLINAIYLKTPVNKKVITMVMKALAEVLIEITERQEAIGIKGVGIIYPHSRRVRTGMVKQSVITTHYKFREAPLLNEKMRKLTRRPYAEIDDAK